MWVGKIPCSWHTHVGKRQLFISPPAYLFLWKVQRWDKVQRKALPEQVHSQLPFTLNGLWVRIEVRASKASSVIHNQLGKGHSNLCEAAFSVLSRFRANHLALHRLTYMTLTNWGLISCLSFLQEVYESDYSPYFDLYSEMGLPILDGMVALWKEDMERRTVHLKQIQTSEVKSDRIHMKNAHVEDQQERKQWAKRQQIQHSYGVEDESDDSDTEVGPLPTIQSTAIADGALLVVSEGSSTGKLLQGSKKSKGSQVQKLCRCGSTSHSRITFRDCPLNKSAVLH